MWKQIGSCFGIVLSLCLIAGSMALDSAAVASSPTSYTNNDFEQAFAQRDQAIEVLAKEIAFLKERITALEDKNNEKNIK